MGVGVGFGVGVGVGVGVVAGAGAGQVLITTELQSHCTLIITNVLMY